MIKARSFAAAIEHNNMIYIFGGYNGLLYEKHNGDPIRDSEYYDIEQNSWKKLPRLKIPRMNSSITISQNKIYIIGGITRTYQWMFFNPRQKYLENYECFDIETKSFSLFKIQNLYLDMNVSHYLKYFYIQKTPVMYCNKIYFFHLCNGKGALKLLLINEIFDPLTGKWTPPEEIKVKINNNATRSSCYAVHDGIFISTRGFENNVPVYRYYYYHIPSKTFK